VLNLRVLFALLAQVPFAGWTAVLTPKLELNTVLYGRERIFTEVAFIDEEPADE